MVFVQQGIQNHSLASEIADINRHQYYLSARVILPGSTTELILEKIPDT